MKISQSKISGFPKQKHDAPDIAKKFGYPMNPMTPDSASIKTGGPNSPSPKLPEELKRKGK